METFKWSEYRKIRGVVLTNSKEEAETVLNSGEGYEQYYPDKDPQFTQNQEMNVYLLIQADR